MLVLSTHCLLYHSETEVAGRLTELYELNHDAIERRRRGGMYAEMAVEWNGGSAGGEEDRAGDRLAQVVEVLWREGMLRREDLYEVVRAQLAHERGLGFEGVGEEDADMADPKGKKRARAEEEGAPKSVPGSLDALALTPVPVFVCRFPPLCSLSA